MLKTLGLWKTTVEQSTGLDPGLYKVNKDDSSSEKDR